MARILLGVSGGIAAYKALEFVRLATAAGHAVRVVQTRASQRFIGAASFAALTGAPVLVSEFEPQGDQPRAIGELTEGVQRGDTHQTLLGVTGSGKTFTVANVIANVQRPSLKARTL